MISSPFYALLIALFFLVVLVTQEAALRKYKLSSETTRIIAHVLSGLVALYIWAYFSSAVFILITLILMGTIVFSQYKNILKSIHGVKRKTYGEVFLPIGILATYILAMGSPEIFVPSILILMLADTASGIVSRTRKLERSSKLGSIAFFAVTIFILSFYALPLERVVIVGLALTVVEYVSDYGSDNLTVPLSSVLLLSL